MAVQKKIIRGVLVVALLGSAYINLSAQDLEAERQRRKDSLANTESFMDIDMGANYIYVVDGLVLKKFFYNKLDTDKIKFSKLLDKAEGRKAYGEIGKDGVVYIETRRVWIVGDTVLKKSDEKKSYLEKVDPESIKKIVSISADQLRDQYNIKNKPGGILLTID